jgi:hypothetical protein
MEKNKDIELNRVVFDLKKSNYNLLLNYCQFEDLINIQNETFAQDIQEFEPVKLLNAVVSET